MYSLRNKKNIGVFRGTWTYTDKSVGQDHDEALEVIQFELIWPEGKLLICLGLCHSRRIRGRIATTAGKRTRTIGVRCT